jgi:putative MATE family efflux protein
MMKLQPPITLLLCYLLLSSSNAFVSTLPSCSSRARVAALPPSPRLCVAKNNESIIIHDDDDDDDDDDFSSWKRFVKSLPKLSSPPDDLDVKILSTAIPTMLNLMVVPIVNAVDTFYVGRLRDPLALAAQSAANQCFFTVYFLAAFLPTITAPVVARAIGNEDWEAAKDRVCESIFLCNVLGGLGAITLIVFPEKVLSLVISETSGSGVLDFAVPYLRCRAFGMVPALLSSCGFAAYNGMLNTVTPLKVTLTTNLLNMILDPLFLFGMGGTGTSIFRRGFGAAGAAAATSVSEFTSSLIYVRLLMRRKLVELSKLLKPPSLKSLMPLIQGGLAILLRQATLNVAFVTAARRAQAMDATGVSGAAYGITMQIYSLGVVAHLGVQATAASMVSASRASSGDNAGRDVADRLFSFGVLLGIILALGQYLLLPLITPLFSPLPEVIEAVKGPAAISSFIHLVNGLVFAGEGTLLGLGAFRDLATITAMGVCVMVGSLLSPMGQSLNGILLSLAAFNTFQGLGVLIHHIRLSPLRRRGFRRKIQDV